MHALLWKTIGCDSFPLRPKILRLILLPQIKNFDKEFLRLWFRENCDPYKDPVLPKAPVELVAELTRRYIEIYETLTGEKFEHDFSKSTLERITNNLAKI